MFVSGAGSISPFGMYIMQSEMDTDNIIKSFEQAMTRGFTSDEALLIAYSENEVNPNDLTDFDKKRLQKKVEALTELYNNNNRRY